MDTTPMSSDDVLNIRAAADSTRKAVDRSRRVFEILATTGTGDGPAPEQEGER